MKYILAFLLVSSFDAQAANVVRQFLLQGQTKVTATTTSTKFLDFNINRAYLMIQNSCASTDFITAKLGTQETAGEGVQIFPCSVLEYAVGPVNSLWLKSNSGSQTVIMTEGNVQ